MGHNKALLNYGGHPLVEHMVGLLKKIRRPHAVQHVYLSGQLENYTCIPDLVPGRGPLGGLHSVVQALENKYAPERFLIVVPVDMPRLKAPTLEGLLTKIRPTVHITHYKDFELPVACRVTEDLKNLLHLYVNSTTQGSGLSVRRLLKAIQQTGGLGRILAEGDDSQFQNANTPREWVELNRTAQVRSQVLVP